MESGCEWVCAGEGEGEGTGWGGDEAVKYKGTLYEIECGQMGEAIEFARWGSSTLL